MSAFDELKKEIKEIVIDAVKEALASNNQDNDLLVGWKNIEQFTGKDKRCLQLHVREGFYDVDGEKAISYNRKNAWASKRLIMMAENKRR